MVKRRIRVVSRNELIVSFTFGNPLLVELIKRTGTEFYLKVDIRLGQTYPFHRRIREGEGYLEQRKVGEFLE